MDYRKHYDLLCERAKTRQLDCYTERHHVVPRCMGGDDSPDNLVDLTPEEHYVAHQLLVKMHPDHRGLVWAAHQMTKHQNGNRNGNKLYGWLKRKNQKIAKQRKGNKNGSYGKSWYHLPGTLENIKCLPDEIPDGFIKGRRIKQEKPNSFCVICGIDTGSKTKKYCSVHFEEHKIRHLANIRESAKKTPNTGNKKCSNDDIAAAIIKNDMNIVEAAKSLGYNTEPKFSGYTSQRFVKIKNALVSPRASTPEKG